MEQMDREQKNGTAEWMEQKNGAEWSREEQMKQEGWNRVEQNGWSRMEQYGAEC
jgi:hypothetical protein